MAGRGENALPVDTAGQLQRTISLADPVRALSVDVLRARLWLATTRGVQAYDQTGAVVQTLNLGGASAVNDISFDATLDQLWVALPSTLRRYGADGTVQLETARPGLEQLSADGQGGLWALSGRTLLRLDAAGQSEVQLEPFAGDPLAVLLQLVADPSDRSVWIASATALRHVSATGQQLHALPLVPNQGAGVILALALYADIIPPAVTITAPAAESLLTTSTPTVEVTYTDVGIGADPTTLLLEEGGTAVPAMCTTTESEAVCTPTTPLPEGPQTLSATLQDHAGNLSDPATVSFTIDTLPPVIMVDSPIEGFLTNQANQTLRGRLNEPATLSVNGQAVTVGADRTFAHPATLQEGLNTFAFSATDLAGHVGTATLHVTLDTTPPAAPEAGQLSVSPLTNGRVTVSGAVGSVEAGALVKLTNLRTGETVTVTANGDGSFAAQIAAQWGDALSLRVYDGAGNASAPSALTAPLPPDPASVAPPVDRTIATTVADSAAFLYSGANPIQTGVAPGTIEVKRIAVLRGRVLKKDNTPLSGVTMTILNHPEYGQTLSRTDGMFDMAVNGGGLLTVNYEKPGYLPAQRQIQAPWQDYAWLPDVVLLQPDPQVTTVDLTSSAPMQVVHGSPVTDASGTRQAAVLIPQGTTATLVLPDGSTQPLTSLNVRLTEYTVGANGPQAMPGALPPTSGYTYAVELSADQALSAGAKEVQLSPPLPLYVDNFLNMPVGTAVPTGVYDRQRAAWLPTANGVVLQVLSVSGGLAQIDSNGDGQPETAATLTALGITSAEQQQLAQTYPVGKKLWRLLVARTGGIDGNWPYIAPTDAIAPNGPAPGAGSSGDDAVTHLDEPDEAAGGGIAYQNQTLGRSAELAGAPFTLTYKSDRVRGRSAAYTVTVPLSGPTIPPSVKRIEAVFTVAGQQVTQTFPPQANLTTTYTWDGKDGYGRVLQGRQTVRVAISYFYDITYLRSAPANPSFGQTSGDPLPQDVVRRGEFSLGEIWESEVGGWDAQALGLGGWSLDVQHGYDVMGQTLYLGDGAQHSSQDLSAANQGVGIQTVAGSTRTSGVVGAGGPATAARLVDPNGVIVDAEGNFYIADGGSHYVLKVNPQGILSIVAGTGSGGSTGDGGPAVNARVDTPWGLALDAPGNLYVSDSSMHRVRKIDRTGLITTVAGTGTACTSATAPCGDGGLATSAQLRNPRGIALDGHGNLYIADTSNNRVRRVDVNGVMTTVAGNGQVFGSYTGSRLATQVSVGSVRGVAVDRQGNVFLSDAANDVIHKLGPDGLITRFAGVFGSGCGGCGGPYNGEGLPATQAFISDPEGLALDAAGTLYIADGVNRRIRRVGIEGVMTTVAGNGANTYSGDGGPPTQAGIPFPFGVAIGPDGALYIATSAGTNTSSDRIRRVRSVLPGFAGLADIVVPARDGSEVYVFNSRGKHLRTVNALTNSLIYEFGYDSAGRLVTNTSTTTIAYTYDGSLLTSSTWDGPIDGSVSWTYDNHYRRTSQSVNGGNTVTFTYDSDDLLTSAGAMTLTRDTANGLLTGSSLGTVTDALTYNGFGEVATYQASAGATTLLSEQYTRDNLGRITQKVETIGGVTTTYAYTYDPAGRLTEVKQNGVVTATYTYDPNSNRLSGPTGTTSTYDAQDRLLTYGGNTYTYTPNGELLTKTTGAQTTTYSYDVLGNLLSVGLPNGTALSYVHDGENRLVGKKLNGTLIQGFLYQDQLEPVAELDGSGNLVSRFVYCNCGKPAPEYMIKNGVTYRIISDHLGSPRLVIDSTTGVIAQRMDYDEFGNVTLDTNPGFQPFGFAGGIYDQHSKLTRFGARDYDAETGRWTAKDPLFFQNVDVGKDIIETVADQANLTGSLSLGAVDVNLYGYAFTDPINLIDPSGMISLAEVSAAIGIGQGLGKILKNIRVKVAVHGPHHRFPWGTKHCHLQLTFWIKGKKGPHFNIRIPIPCTSKENDPKK